MKDWECLKTARVNDGLSFHLLHFKGSTRLQTLLKESIDCQNTKANRVGSRGEKELKFSFSKR